VVDKVGATPSAEFPIRFVHGAAERIAFAISLKFAAGTRICREFEVARTVLVVDDDPLVLEVAADMLNDSAAR
jgi:hypothetical protein